MALSVNNKGPGGVGETFIVNVKFQQNATWQGTVRWGPGGQEIAFRSALELLKIMDRALEDEPDPKAKAPSARQDE